MKELKLGVIGLSPGNGHPYSWSAIFNGYTPELMEDCGFPVIPRYLEKQKYPDDCIPSAKVTHIWTQDTNLSKKVADASLIPNVVENLEDMIGEVDAILLARDDSETHYEFAKPFIEAGLPIYIDKPLATSLEEANRIYGLEKYPGQIFTCSAMGFAPELSLNMPIETVRYVDATVIKDWNKYGIHIIDPVIRLIGADATVQNVTANDCNGYKTVVVNLSNGITCCFKTLKDCKCGFKITVYGTEGTQGINFLDTFSTFKNALFEFVQIVRKQKNNSSKNLTLKFIDIVERGNHV